MKNVFPTGDHNPIHVNKWYDVKYIPTHDKQCESTLHTLQYDVIVKNWDAATDKFTYSRIPNCIIRPEDEDDYPPVFVWRTHSGGAIPGRVVAFLVHPSWENVFHSIPLPPQDSVI